MTTPLLNRVTLVIPTYNRPGYLRRLLQFYKSVALPSKVLVLDSSSKDFSDPELLRLLNDERVTYLKYPSDRLPIQKLAAGLKHVETEYVVFCADDDFVLPRGIEESVQFLAGHLDYSLAQGCYITFVQKGILSANVFQEVDWFPQYENQVSIEDESPSKRVLAHLTHYRGPTFYAVHRTVQLQKIMEATANATSDWGVTELLPAALALTYGKLKTLPVFYCARADGAQTGGGAVGSSIQDWYSPERCKIASNCLAAQLMEVENLTQEEAFQKADECIHAYLLRNSRLKFSKVRGSLIQKIKNLLGPRFLALLKMLLFRSEIVNKDIRLSKEKYTLLVEPELAKLRQFMRIKGEHT